MIETANALLICCAIFWSKESWNKENSAAFFMAGGVCFVVSMLLRFF